MKWIKRMLLVLVVGFVLFYLVSPRVRPMPSVVPPPPWEPPSTP